MFITTSRHSPSRARQSSRRTIPLAARIFCYLPLEHAEDAALQTHSVIAFEDLAAQAQEAGDAQVSHLLAGALDYAQRHQSVIEQFGRFPHRNRPLGRRSTADEMEYLTKPGSGF